MDIGGQIVFNLALNYSLGLPFSGGNCLVSEPTYLGFGFNRMGFGYGRFFYYELYEKLLKGGEDK